MANKLLRYLSLTLLTISIAYADSGGYINPAIGYANINSWWSAALAVTINGGYQVNDYLAGEAGITWINPLTTQNPPYASYQQGQWFADIAAKGSLPLSDIFKIYAKGGFGVGYAQSSIAMPVATNATDWGNNSAATSFGLYMALGGELFLNRQFSFTFEDYGLMPLFGNSWGNINVFGVGGRYRF